MKTTTLIAASLLTVGLGVTGGNMYDKRLFKLAKKMGWKIPHANNPYPPHSWNAYWSAMEQYTRDPNSGRPVAPHRPGV